MIEKIRAVVTNCGPKSILINIAGFDIKLIANSANFPCGEVFDVFTYMHWNQETGPALYGFRTSLEKEAFLVLIECPKVGPSLAMSILSQIVPTELFYLIAQEQDVKLAKINGIGPKSAKNLVTFLKDKAIAFLQVHHKDMIFASDQTGLADVKEALAALGYLQAEIQSVLKDIDAAKNLTSFEQKLRYGLELLRKSV